LSTVAIIVTIGVFAAIIVFHEFGHFIMAKLAGIPVYEFALGFGRPVLLSFKWRGTQYSLRPIPVGGYVRIAGMEPDENVPNGFDKKPIIARLAVIAAGAGMNFVLAIILFWIMGLAFGKVTGYTTELARVMSGTPAAAAGLQVGDKLVFAEPIAPEAAKAAVRAVSSPPQPMSLESLRKVISGRPGKPIELVVKRGRGYLAFRITPAAEQQQELQEVGGRHPRPAGLLTRFLRLLHVRVPPGKTRIVTKTVGLIGVVFEDIRASKGFLDSVRDGFVDAYQTTATLIGALVLTVVGKLPPAVGGPVQIGEIMTESFRVGWAQFLMWSALISVNVGVINLLPIPALDGSRLVFIIIEGIRRRPIDRRKEAIVHLVGFALLLMFLAFVTFRDVVQLINKHYG
jgi:regulator of sigma E protease